MRFKNKKTGEIGWLYCDHISQKKITVFAEERNLSAKHWDYASLADLNAEWEDAPEEPKEYWFINPEGEVTSMDEEYEDEEDTKATKEIGNCFLSREEAELAVRKLKAWKRLKDKCFRFYRWNKGSLLKSLPNTIEFACDDTKMWTWEDIQDDLDLLFCTEVKND